MANRLNPNEDLAVIGSITSQDGRSTFVMQGDGNLVLYRSGGKARWASDTYGKTVSRAIMQTDGNFVLYGPGGPIWDTRTYGNPGAYLVVQDDGNVVIYAPNNNPLWATNTNIIQVRVPGFLPSTSGFHFSNTSWPNMPDLRIDVLGQHIEIGNAQNGLCGGMVFAVRDYFEAGLPIPDEPTNPLAGPVFDFIVKRLFDSFNLMLPFPPPFIPPLPPFGPGPSTYMWLMDPNLPDHETDLSRLGLAPHGRAWTMINSEWPKIKTDLENHKLSPISLIEIKSADPTLLGKNHQVLAYGYDLDGSDLEILVYDPNAPGNDLVTLSLSIANPQNTTAVTSSLNSTILCFFRPNYTFSPPPPPPTPIPPGAFQVLVHLQGLGDQVFQAGQYAGTRGQSRRLEGFQITFTPPVAGLGMLYYAHVQDIGNTPWMPDGNFAGTRAQGRRVEGFAIKLTGRLAKNYNVEYMAHIQNLGDTPFVRNGSYCGTRGRGLMLEGMQVRIIKK